MTIWVFLNAAVLFLAWLFASAGLHKLMQNKQELIALVEEAGLANETNAQILVPLLGLAELATTFLLILPPTRTIGLTLACLLCLSYLAYISYLILRGRTDIKCGCAGFSSDMRISPHLFFRNLTLCILSFTALVNVHYTIEATVFWFWLLSGALAAAVTLLYICMDQLIVNAQKLEQLKT